MLATGRQSAVEARLAAVRRAGAIELTDDDYLELRVLAGVPAGGAELTDARHPLEAGLAADISFTKGCYTGQEVVARQDAYGKVTRRLVGLAFGAPPASGETLASEAKEGCSVTSVAPEPVGPATGVDDAGRDDDAGSRSATAHWPCLGFVAARNAVDGNPVVTASGLEGRVVPLPFGAIR